MPGENEIDNFETLLADKRHKELSGVLKRILDTVGKEKKDDGLTEAVGKLINKIDEIKQIELPDFPLPKLPDVKVETNQKEVVASLEKLSSELLSELVRYNERPLVDEFKIERDQWMNIKTVKVIYKVGSQIMYNKPKAQA